VVSILPGIPKIPWGSGGGVLLGGSQGLLDHAPLLLGAGGGLVTVGAYRCGPNRMEGLYRLTAPI